MITECFQTELFGNQLGRDCRIEESHDSRSELLQLRHERTVKLGLGLLESDLHLELLENPLVETAEVTQVHQGRPRVLHDLLGHARPTARGDQVLAFPGVPALHGVGDECKGRHVDPLVEVVEIEVREGHGDGELGLLGLVVGREPDVLGRGRRHGALVHGRRRGYGRDLVVLDVGREPGDGEDGGGGRFVAESRQRRVEGAVQGARAVCVGVFVPVHVLEVGPVAIVQHAVGADVDRGGI
ncbi:uncharacterized protein N7459_008667 [Penicillium hispanicum]|uniref:uncharacterized protein n=1 Tax=Penicillium hispanicum TaxID=1080232 RepID=UPI00253F65F9|nr:uncharacterized protein N7459_008667 [Penicillium hispanicum]KAJ5574240.1 hypothetical protein N7459_008667 [Penicillium hispanicum]